VGPRARIATDDGGGIDQVVASEQLVSRVRAAKQVVSRPRVDHLPANHPVRPRPSGVTVVVRIAARAVVMIVAAVVVVVGPIVIAIVATTAARHR
jgi:hypothetical protein